MSEPVKLGRYEGRHEPGCYIFLGQVTNANGEIIERPGKCTCLVATLERRDEEIERLRNELAVLRRG